MNVVEVGQIWKDNDKRVAPEAPERFLRIERIDGRFAVCNRVVVDVDAPGGWRPLPFRTREVHIQIKRLKPTATGYVRVL